MKDATQGARFRVPGLPGCTINGRPHVTRPRAPGSCIIPKPNTNGVGGTGNQSPNIWVWIRIQQALPLQRGWYRDDTWELLFVLRVQAPAQGLGIHSETPSYTRNAIIPASPGPCKGDYVTLSIPIFYEVLFPIPLDFGFPSSKAQILVSPQDPFLAADLPQ